jgi:hypothetical protein
MPVPLELPRYLLGVAEIAWLAGFAVLGGAALRGRLLPAFDGAPAVLATAVLALGLLILSAQVVGTVGLFEPLPYLVVGALVGAALRLWLGGGRGCPACLLDFSRRGGRPSEEAGGRKINAAVPAGHPRPPSRDRGLGTGEGPEVATLVSLVALAIAGAALVKFGLEVKPKLTTGMTGFDSTWYHGPFAAGFFQSGSTWDLHFIAPQFLAWFYPANAELFHAGGMLAFDRDLLSPLLNLGWFLGCLLACWCIGRPYGVGPWSLALGAVALSLPVLSDQAGEARNDIVGIFFLLAAVAIAVNAWSARVPGATGSKADDGSRTRDREPPPGEDPDRERTGVPAGGRPVPTLEVPPGTGSLAVAGLAAGLAVGTKLNFLLPAAVLVLGPALAARGGARWRAFGVGTLAALLGGGYWYLRNLVQSGNPLPWFTDIGPVALPGPDQELGGREGHSVFGYLFDGAVWSDWFLPGLSDGLTVLWPLLAALALAGLALSAYPALRCAFARNGRGKEQRSGVWRADGALAVAGLAGLAALLAWLIAPTSASGPEGMPRGFESGLRYLAPALVLGLALLPTVPQLRGGLSRLAGLTAAGKEKGSEGAEADRSGAEAGGDAEEAGVGRPPNGRILKSPATLGRRLSGRGTPHARLAALLVAAIAVAIGYPVQRHYLENRYADPSFAAPGLNAAFEWSQGVTDSRIATTTTRQYPLLGPDLSNQVQFIGEPRPDGGFEAPTTCRAWRRLLIEGDYDYAVTSRDRIELNKPPYPATSAWTEDVQSQTILSVPPTKVHKLSQPLDPSAC